MTNEPLDELELNYIYDSVGFHAGHIEKFVNSMSFGDLLAALGYVKGFIEAQVSDTEVACAIDRIANLTRDVLYPRAIDQFGAPEPGKLKIYYPATANTKLVFPKGSEKIQ